ncbi:MAG: zinc ribbon domain-containing protein [Ruminococcaceae bacterium]|nr:zinc ribbon domain-containing protein [Oscillospiraceae bacterium]
MKCPYCSKEIKDDALFCGFCGKQIPQKPLKEASPAPPADELKIEVSESVNNASSEIGEAPQKVSTRNESKNKCTSSKVLLVFVLFAFVAGSILGFLTARGVVTLESLISNNNFKWTSFSEGLTETLETEEHSENKDSGKEESSDSSAPIDEEVDVPPSTETTDSSSETTFPEETQ